MVAAAPARNTVLFHVPGEPEQGIAIADVLKRVGRIWPTGVSHDWVWMWTWRVAGPLVFQAPEWGVHCCPSKVTEVMP